jgi:hypothetical protein
MRTSIKIALALGVGLVLGYFAWQVLPGLLSKNEDPRSQARLSRIAAELNRSVPVMIDAETELMPSETAEGLFVYNYRLVNYSAGQIDRAKFTAGAKQRVTQSACTRAETRDEFLDKGVTLRYTYYDKDKKQIATFDVKPEDCASYR